MPLKQLINTKGDNSPKQPASNVGSAASAQSQSLASAAGNSGASTGGAGGAGGGRPVMSGKNVLSSDVEIKGSLKFSNDLIIDGKIDGEVISDGSLTVGENAIVKGEIKTKSVTIFGRVEANVTVAERCQLKTNAVLEGDVAAGTLAIEEGSTFMGSSSVGRKSSGGSSVASAPAKSAPANPKAGAPA